jgi:hypothetical protein
MQEAFAPSTVPPTMQQAFAPSETTAPRAPRILEPVKSAEELAAEAAARKAEDKAAKYKARKQREAEKLAAQKAEHPILGRKDLSPEQKKKLVYDDPAEVEAIFKRLVPAQGQEDYAQPVLLQQRLAQILDEANARKVDMWEKINPNTPNYMVWLKNVKDTHDQIVEAGPESGAAKAAVLKFQAGEIAAAQGNFDIFRMEHGAKSTARTGGTAQTKAGAKAQTTDVEKLGSEEGAAGARIEKDEVFEEGSVAAETAELEAELEEDTSTEISELQAYTPAPKPQKEVVAGVDYTVPTKKSGPAVVQAIRKGQRQKVEGVAPRPAGKVTLKPRKPVEDTEKQARQEEQQVQDNVEAVVPPDERRVDEAVMTRRRGPTDPAAQERQERQNSELAHKVDSVNFFGNWVKPVQEMSLRGAIERFAGRSNNTLVEKIRQQILDVVSKARGDIPVYILDPRDIEVSKGKPPSSNPVSSAYYMPWHTDNPGGKEYIVVNAAYWRDETLAHYLLAHEAVHSVTSDFLRHMPGMMNVLKQVLAQVKQYNNLEGYINEQWFIDMLDEGVFDTHYGVTNMREMLAEITDPKFMEYLKKTPVSRFLTKKMGLEPWRKATAWNSIVALVRKAFAWLGFEQSFSALDVVMSTIERSAHAYDPAALSDYMRRATLTGAIKDEGFRATEAYYAKGRRAFKQTQKWRAEQVDKYYEALSDKEANDIDERVSIESTTELARAAGQRATYAPGGASRWFLKLRSLDSLMRGYEHLFPTDALRRYVNAIVKRYTLSRQRIGEDSKLLVEENQHLTKYKDTKINGVSAQEHYAELANAMDNWKVDPRLNLTQHTWLGTSASKGAVAKHHYPQIVKAYNELKAAAPDLATYLGKRMDYFANKDKQAINVLLTETVLDAAEAKGHNPTNAQALTLGRRIVEKTGTPAQIAADKVFLGDAAYKRIARTPEFKPRYGPYQPQRRWGDWIVSANIDVADPTSGQWTKPPADKYRNLTGYNVDFYGPNAQAEAEKFAAARDMDEYAEVKPIWTDAQGFEHDQVTGHKYQKKDTQSQQRYRVFVQDEHTAFFESQYEADEATKKLQGDKYYKSVKPTRLKQGEPPPGQALAGSHQLQQIAESLEKRMNTFGATPQQIGQLKAVLMEAAHRASPGQSISKHRIQRRHVQGNSRDTLRVMHDYIQAINNYIVAVETARETHEAYKALEEYARGSYSSDPINAQAVLNEIKGRQNAMVGMHEKGSLVSLATSWQFVDKLGSPGYSIVNMTQLPMVGIPVLAEKHGFFTAARAIGKAAKQIGYVQNLKQGGKDTWEALRQRLDTATSFHEFIKSGNLTSEVKTMLDKLVDYGSLDPDAGFEAMQIVNRGKLSSAMDMVETIFRQFPRAVEANNRYTMAIAGYELAKAKGMSVEKATEYARDVVDRSQFNYNPVNSAPFFNKWWAQIGLQFMKFGFNMYQLMGSQIATTLGYKNATKAERLEALRGFTYLLGAHVIMAGVAGLPTEPLRVPIEILRALGIADASWDDVEAYVREVMAETTGSTKFAEVLARGLPRALGMDVSNRLTLGQLVFQRPMGELDEPGAVFNYMMKYIGGPTAQNVDDLFVGARDLTEGNIARAVEKIVPVKMLSDAAKAFRGATEGIKTRYGDVYQTYSPAGAVLQTLGITPAENANVTESRERYFSLTNRQRDERSAILLDYFEATPAERAKFYRRFQEFNKRWNPQNPLSFNAAREYVSGKKGTYKKGIKEEPSNRRLLRQIEQQYGP